MPIIPPSSNQKLPERLVIQPLVKLTAPNKMVFCAVHTRKVAGDHGQYKRVLARGFAIYWRREKSKTKEMVEEYEYDNAMDYATWLCEHVNKRETLYVYSHDLTTDFLALDGFRMLPVHDFTLQSIYHRLTTSILKLSNDSRRLTFLDIQNYYPIKLDKLARSFGLEVSTEVREDATDYEVDEWLRSKAQLLKTIVEGLIKETVEAKRGSLRMTSGATSQSIFRASYMKHKIITNHNPQVVEFERSSYVGGYTGLNKLVESGAPELYKVDVNSMYPSVMLEKDYPAQMIEFAGAVSLHTLQRYLKDYLVIANVTMNAKRPYYPFRHFEQSYYPLGEFDTSLSTASLRSALENDEVQKVNHMAVYMGAPIFSDFVTDVYGRRMQARQEGNTAQELLHKMVSNTLYGKFGQMNTETTVIGQAPIDEFSVMDAYDPANNTSWVEMHAGGSILFIQKKGETRYTSFAIASHITDYARVKLFELMNKAGRANVFYSDTDSLIVNREGLHNLYPDIHQTKLGLLKLEGVAPWFIGFAKKDYIFGDVRKLKGFDAKGRRVDDNIFENFQRVSMGGAMSKRLSAGAYWVAVNKFYNPFIVGERLTDAGAITPLELPRDIMRVSEKTYTMRKVKEMARYMLPVSQMGEISEWLRL